MRAARDGAPVWSEFGECQGKKIFDGGQLVDAVFADEEHANGASGAGLILHQGLAAVAAGGDGHVLEGALGGACGDGDGLELGLGLLSAGIEAG